MAEWCVRNFFNVEKTSKKMGIDKMTLSILLNRGIRTEEKIKKFLNPSIQDLYDPFIMKNMDKGTKIIKKAIDKGCKITIYGDYDMDGISSCYILYRALQKCKAKVDYYLPDRGTEGYGLNSERIKKLKYQGTQVILTCDNGISAIKQIRLANALGITVVVTDHHEITYECDENGVKRQVLPQAAAVINPKRYDDSYPFKLLTGAGVAYKFAKALYKKMNLDDDSDSFLEIAALGTVCDVQDLLDENRVIVYEGLKQLNHTGNIGLKALIKECGLEGKHINSYSIGFIIGPACNASGRLDTALKAEKLLLSTNKENAESLAKELVSLNRTRQALCDKALLECVDLVESSDEFKNDKVLVIYNSNVHESIAGIVAGKIREKYNKPTIVLTKSRQQGIAKGSGRSIEKYDMFLELNKVKNLMIGFGGHKMAAGLSMETKKIGMFRNELNRLTTLRDDDIVPKIIIDYCLPINELNFDVVSKIKKLEPFGKGNPSPLLAEKNINVFRIYSLGRDGKHIKLFCKVPGKNDKIDALGFNMMQKVKDMPINDILNKPVDIKLDMVYSPDVNEYKGKKTIQMLVRDLRMSV